MVMQYVMIQKFPLLSGSLKRFALGNREQSSVIYDVRDGNNPITAQVKNTISKNGIKR